MDIRQRDELLAEISELYGLVLHVASHVHAGDLPLTATQRLALIEVAAVGPIRPRSLARRMHTTPATATRAVDVLEELGLVERKADPEDRRGVLVHATTRGARWASRRADAVRDVLDRVPDACTPARFVTDLARFNSALRHAVGQEDTLTGQLLPPE